MDKKRILLNGLIFAPDGTGVSRYAENLIKQFAVSSLNIDIVLRGIYRNKFPKSEKLIFWDDDIRSTTQRIITEQWMLRNLYRKYKIVHFPDYASPIFTLTDSVSTIHDLSMITMSAYRPFMQNIVKNIFLRNTICRNKALICDSYFTRNELLKYFPSLETKSRVVYLGIDSPDTNINESIVEELSLVPYEYLIYVGTLAPHKNIVRLINSFSILVKDGYSGKLVIAGGKGWLYKEIFNVVKKHRLEKQIVFTGYISQAELEGLYKYACVLVNSSMYEGFGLPPLEAMIRNIPAIVSNIPVFKEICSDAAIYFEPYDEKDMADKIRMVLDDKQLKKEMMAKGLDKVKDFSWEKCARETLKVYEEVLERQ